MTAVSDHYVIRCPHQGCREDSFTFLGNLRRHLLFHCKRLCASCRRGSLCYVGRTSIAVQDVIKHEDDDAPARADGAGAQPCVAASMQLVTTDTPRGRMHLIPTPRHPRRKVALAVAGTTDALPTPPHPWRKVALAVAGTTDALAPTATVAGNKLAPTLRYVCNEGGKCFDRSWT